MRHSRHPFIRRFNWHPAVVAIPLAYFVYRLATHGVTTARVAGTVVVVVWFVLATINSLTKDGLLNWMYSDEERETGRQ